MASPIPAATPVGARPGASARSARALRWAASGALVGPAALVLGVMVAAPLVTLVWYALTPDGLGGGGLTLENVSHLFSTPLYLRQLLKTLVTAAIAAGLTVLLAWPSGWALSRLPARRRNLLLSLVIVPYLTSYLLLIYAIFVLLGSDGPLFSALHALGLTGKDTSLLYRPAATVIVLVYENLPIALFVLYSTSDQIGRDLLTAAGSLGARPLARFRHVVLPLSGSGLFTAFVLVFVPMCGAFVEPQVLGGPTGSLLGNTINDQLTTISAPHFASTLSLLLLLGIFAMVAALHGLQAAARALGAREGGIAGA
jgi:spermidine/putrescine transport system permease protein